MAQITNAQENYTFGHDKTVLQSHLSRTAESIAAYLIPHIKEDAKVLDVGCGPGTITCGFAKIAHKGSTIGLDVSDQVIAEAEQIAKSQNIANIRFMVGDGSSLPFPDNSFDVVHIHATMCHVSNPLEVFQEMRRVCREGGVVGIREGDWETTIIYPDPTKNLKKWITTYGQLMTKAGGNPFCGRVLCEWALQMGYSRDKINITGGALLYAEPDDRKFWGNTQGDRVESTKAAQKIVEMGLGTEQDCADMAAAWREWSRQDSGIYVVYCTQMLCWK